jgi:Na+/phosphate symporter
MSTAREVLARILLFGIVPGGVLAALFMAGQTVLPAAFTTDAAVIAAVAHVVPLLAICMVCATMSSRFQRILLRVPTDEPCSRRDLQKRSQSKERLSGRKLPEPSIALCSAI